MSQQITSAGTREAFLALEEVDGLLKSHAAESDDEEIPPLRFDRHPGPLSTLAAKSSQRFTFGTSSPQDALKNLGRSPSPVTDGARSSVHPITHSRVSASPSAVTDATTAQGPVDHYRAPVRIELDDEYAFDMDADLAMAEDEGHGQGQLPHEQDHEQPPIDLDEQEDDDDDAGSDIGEHLANLRRAAAQLRDVMVGEDGDEEADEEQRGPVDAQYPAVAGPSIADNGDKSSDVGERLALHGVGRRAPAAQSSTEREMEARAVATTSTSVATFDALIGMDGIPKYIPAGTFGATAMNGESVRFERRRRMRGWKSAPPHFGKGSTGLLSEPAYILIQKAEMAAAEAVVQNDERLAARRAKLAAAQAKRSANAIEQGGVWVEKYRPKRYTELLGDDRTHRDVMSWLKSWDACVYKRKAKKHARDEIHTGASSYGSGYHARRTEAYSDAWNRPEQRILLLSGPPGLGKTTLAHVIANSCGYAVHELNASDARNSAAIEDRVKVALESGAALGDHRPTCVVIDEIDGATGGTGEGPSFIKSLVRLVEVGNALDAANKGKGKKKKQQRPLLRPIICICNDLYAPALRPLRPLARLVRVGKPAANHLVARLRTVCEAEGLSTDTRALNLLAELTDCDVRSCLNALQLAKAQGNTLEASQVRDKEGNGLAVKDGGSSTAKVFELLFRTPTPKERARGVGAKDGHETMSRIVDEVTSCGEQERLLHGCFEHYPTLRLVDDGFLRFKKIHDWMAWNEAVHAKGWELATHELAGYLPWAFAPWHFLFANTANELPGFAKVDYQNHLKRTAFDEIAAELYTSLPPGLRIMFGKEAVVTELGPSLMRMLSPDLRPINAQITRPGEKEILAAVVQILISLGLSLQQDRTEEGQLIMRLEPALDAFVQYEGKRSKEVGPARYAIRSAIAKEVEAVKMRIKSLSVSAGMDAMGQPVRHEELAAKAAAGAIAVYKNGGDSALLDSGALFSSALTTTTTTTTRKVAVDFFGRKILPAAAPLAPVAPDKLAEIQSDQAAIRETEAQVAKKKAAAAQQAAPLPSLLLERRAARAAAEGAANPHVRLPPASGAAPDAKRQRLQAA